MLISFTLRLLLAFMLAPVLLLSGCAKRSGMDFDIPAGIASETFCEFARQAGIEIIFDPETVEGVETNAISGFMSPTDALQVMIKDTGFYIHQDPMSEAIAIRKSDWK